MQSFKEQQEEIRKLSSEINAKKQSLYITIALNFFLQIKKIKEINPLLDYQTDSLEIGDATGATQRLA